MGCVRTSLVATVYAPLMTLAKKHIWAFMPCFVEAKRGWRRAQCPINASMSGLGAPSKY
jgi:hypothetical protein